MSLIFQGKVLVRNFGGFYSSAVVRVLDLLPLISGMYEKCHDLVYCQKVVNSYNSCYAALFLLFITYSW